MADWRPMTALERQAAIELSHVTYPVGSPPKRLARSLAAQANQVHGLITDAQAKAMWRQAYRFRRQLTRGGRVRWFAEQYEAALLGSVEAAEALANVDAPQGREEGK